MLPRPDASALLRAPVLLEVALLAAAAVEEVHPALAAVAAGDPRTPWQRVRDTARLVRARRADPARALLLAARERALATSPVTPVHDPSLVHGARHALRVSCALATAAAAGRVPGREAAERWAREEVAVGVLLGAEPDELPTTPAAVGALLEAVRADVEGAAAGPRLPSAALAGARGPDPDWARAARLAPHVLPGWARALVPGAAAASGEEARAELARWAAAALAAGGRGRAR
ncbi:hypothetical protein [Kineococcus sp. SYSU DK004]|uniref:hypothetical protein n=1 Tax=Kineococcus sp. SYSU DK004 TaxID=3383125 RepID=UPI003D7DC2F2